MVASRAYVANILAIFTKATEANRNTPGREGNVIVLTPALADEVMITGDLHGHRRNFNLIKKIADLEANPRRHLVLQEVCHGGPTYPQNGGCMSHIMLEDVARLKVEFPERVHFILGNHELAEMADFPIQKNRQMLNLLFRLGMQQMYGAAAEEVREAIFPFLRSCPLAVRLPGGVMATHSTPEQVAEQGFDRDIFHRPLHDDDFLQRGTVFQLVWGRDYRPENAKAFAELVGAKVLINGHEPCPAGFSAPNDTQIIIDCCADQAAYAILPTDQDLTHAEILQRIQKLE
jgi:hypothetical protein